MAGRCDADGSAGGSATRRGVRRRGRRRRPACWPPACWSGRRCSPGGRSPAEAPPPRCDGRLRPRATTATPLRLAVLGDSSAAGYGVDAPRETLGALLAAGLAEQAAPAGAAALPGRGRLPVARGCRRRWTRRSDRADLAVIIIGGNDVTHRASVPERGAAPGRRGTRAARGRRRGRRRHLPRPGHDPADPAAAALAGPAVEPAAGRARRRSRWSRPAGGRSRSATCSARSSPPSPDRMFGLDRFHPSADGYLAAAAAVLPTVVAALTEPAGRAATAPLPAGAGVRSPAAGRGGGRRERSGTEVAAPPQSMAGRARPGGPLGARCAAGSWHRLP